MTTWLMHIACWIPKATNTHSQCVIFIAFPLHQYLHGRASMLCTLPVLFLSTWGNVDETVEGIVTQSSVEVEQ
jgi:hypothetical protein